MTDAPTCVVCRAYVQKDWDWCEACGFDPNHLKPDGWQPRDEPHELSPVETAPRAALWAPVASFRPEEPTKVQLPRHAPRRSAGGWMIIAVALVAAVAVVGLGTSRILGQEVSAIAAGQVGPTVSTVPPWQTVDADGLFTLSMPGAPSLSDGTTKDGRPEKTMLWRSGTDTYRASWHAEDATTASPEEQRVRLTGLADELRAAGSTVTIADRFGRTVIAFEGRNIDGQPLRGQIIVATTRVVTLVVSGPAAVAQADRFFEGYAP